MFKNPGKKWSASKKAEYKGITFDSKAELKYYLILQKLLSEKKIKKVERQVRFKLPDMDGGFRFSYTCDFVVTKNDGKKVYLEVKGRWLAGNKIRYAYWQTYYNKKLHVIFTTGLKKFNTGWLDK